MDEEELLAGIKRNDAKKKKWQTWEDIKKIYDLKKKQTKIEWDIGRRPRTERAILINIVKGCINLINSNFSSCNYFQGVKNKNKTFLNWYILRGEYLLLAKS